MRELLMKNSKTKNRKRSELFFSEHFEQEKSVQDIEKRIIYQLKEVLEFTQPLDLTMYLEQKKKEDSPPHRYIIKSRDTRSAVCRIIEKNVAKQYVIVHDKIFVFKVSQSLTRTITLKQKPSSV